MTVSETNMPAESAVSSGLRPILSTVAMAMNVTTTLVTDVMTDVVSASDSLNPRPATGWWSSRR